VASPSPDADAVASGERNGAPFGFESGQHRRPDIAPPASPCGLRLAVGNYEEALSKLHVLSADTVDLFRPHPYFLHQHRYVSQHRSPFSRYFSCSSYLFPVFGSSLLYQGERNDFLFRRACAWRRRGAQPGEIERRFLADYVLRYIIGILFRCSFCGRGSTEPHCSRRCAFGRKHNG
jgi:Primase C terminal 1 (PriCT-1)